MTHKPWVIGREDELYVVPNPKPWAGWIDDELDHELMKIPKDDSLEERGKKKNKIPFCRLRRYQNEFCARDAHWWTERTYLIVCQNFYCALLSNGLKFNAIHVALCHQSTKKLNSLCNILNTPSFNNKSRQNIFLVIKRRWWFFE